MRIGIDLRIHYHQTAGISYYAIRLLTALAQVDKENEYWLLQHRKERKQLVRGPRFKRKTLFTPTHRRFEQWFLSQETRLHRLDLIHSPDFIPPLHNRIPAVITIHDLAFLLYPKFVTGESARYYGQVEVAVKRANRIIAVSHSTKQDIIKLLGAPEEKIDVIYEAGDDFFRPIPSQEARSILAKAGKRLPERFILFVGTIEPRKNIKTLIQAYKILKDRYGHDVSLVLAGATGWLADDVYELVEKLDIEQDVHFLGRTSNEHLLALYNLAIALAHPAYYEGFGLPLLEAMTCGAPVICSNVSSLPEVVGDAAILISPEDVEMWVAGLHRVIADADLRQEMSRKGLARAKAFSWEKAARETLATYRRAVS